MLLHFHGAMPGGRSHPPWAELPTGWCISSPGVPVDEDASGSKVVVMRDWPTPGRG
jgi:hypothetical protein